MKIAKLTADGDIVATPCKIYKIIVTGTNAGDDVIVKDSATALLRVFIPANTTYVIDLFNTPIVCVTKCTLDITKAGTVEVSVIYEDWAL